MTPTLLNQRRNRLKITKQTWPWKQEINTSWFYLSVELGEEFRLYEQQKHRAKWGFLIFSSLNMKKRRNMFIIENKRDEL